jgi:hydroxyacylglutathione hydrolase
MKICEGLYLVASGKMGFDWTHPSDCNVYLLESNGELALIDTGTGYSVDEILQNIEAFGFSRFQLKKIFITHIHADHAGGAALLQEKTGAQVFVFEKAYETLKSGDEDAIDLTPAKKAGFYPLDYQFIPCKADNLLNEGDIHSIGDLKLEVIETPGHSRFDLSFVVTDHQGTVYLFSGDTVLFDGKISMLNTQDFNIQQLARSVDKLSEVNAKLLLPGHYHPALTNGMEHVQRANRIFKNLGVPTNIV